MKTKYTYIPYLITFMMVILMITIATLFDEPEIIFPEITALTIGCWLSPQQIWKTSQIRLVGLILIYSLLGVIMVKYITLPLYIKVISALFMCLVGLRMSKTTFAPLISACLLPILMETQTWIYPLAATTMTIIVVGIQKQLDRYSLHQKSSYHSKHIEKEKLSLMLKRMIVVSLMLCLAFYIGYPLFIAPPLIVAFIELSGPHKNLRKKSPYLFLMAVFMAFIGAYARYFLTIQWGFSLILTTAIVTAILLLCIAITHIMFPPIGAITILPMIIDVELLLVYPILIACSFALFIASAKTISYQRQGNIHESVKNYQ